MFGKVASDMLGLSDIGSVIRPENYNQVESDDYVMHEEGEKIYFLIKSKSDEYCFTNQAFIHLDGNSAMSKKRMLHRYSYSKNRFHRVRLETAGTVDLDIEIKFGMGEKEFSIDVHKKHLEELKDLYKTLIKISDLQYDDELSFKAAHQSIELSANTLGRVSKADINLVEQFQAVNQFSFEWLNKARKQFVRKDFGEVFEKFINT